MSSRIPLPYSPKVLEIFRNPKNVGQLEDADVVESAGSPACGDMIRLYLKITNIDGEDVIEKASFESYGCAANIAAASILTEMIKGKRVEDAWKISWRVLSDELGGLPPIKYHCSIL
ncbi:MAG: iron-sulfur cluster assembly scaffold protein, partial [Desulfurococcaceae archaeon]|nr:iron-sulfur cluster assembly scaffold protein [Desulfurococcaceae archaeon]